AALKGLEHGDAIIGKSANGAPVWPEGITGSITHTRGYAAALVGETRFFSGIGLDAERVGGVTQDLWPRLFTQRERDHLMGLDQATQPVVATLIFSAKEACFKAWGGVGTLAFRDIDVTPDRDGFHAEFRLYVRDQFHAQQGMAAQGKEIVFRLHGFDAQRLCPDGANLVLQTSGHDLHFFKDTGGI